MGVMRSYDQFSNIVLEDTHERHFVGGELAYSQNQTSFTPDLWKNGLTSEPTSCVHNTQFLGGCDAKASIGMVAGGCT